jgi:hypothetical protein
LWWDSVPETAVECIGPYYLKCNIHYIVYMSIIWLHMNKSFKCVCLQCHICSQVMFTWIKLIIMFTFVTALRYFCLLRVHIFSITLTMHDCHHDVIILYIWLNHICTGTLNHLWSICPFSKLSIVDMKFHLIYDSIWVWDRLRERFIPKLVRFCTRT